MKSLRFSKYIGKFKCAY